MAYNIDEKIAKLQKKEKNQDATIFMAVNDVSKEIALDLLNKEDNNIKIESFYNDDDIIKKTEDLQSKYNYYFENKKLDKFSNEVIELVGLKFIEWCHDKGSYYAKKFFSDLMISPMTLEIFKNRSDKFKELYDIGMDILESKLVEDSLKMDSNIRPNSAQFVLMNAHNMAMTSKAIKDNKEEEALQKLKTSVSKEGLKNLLDMVKNGKVVKSVIKK